MLGPIVCVCVCVCVCASTACWHSVAKQARPRSGALNLGIGREFLAFA